MKDAIRALALSIGLIGSGLAAPACANPIPQGWIAQVSLHRDLPITIMSRHVTMKLANNATAATSFIGLDQGRQ